MPHGGNREGLPQLVCAARAGDRAAFSALVARFQDMAYAAAYARLRDPDLAQDAFIAAYTGMGRLNDPAAFPGWFRQIVARQCTRILRRRDLSVLPLEAACTLPASEPEPGRAMEERERREWVREAIDALPEHERSTTVLFYIRDYSLQEIGEFLDIPVGTVKTRLHSARRRMKERMMTMLQDDLLDQRPSRSEAFARRVLQIADALAIKTFARRGAFDIAPDGEYVAFVVQDPERGESFRPPHWPHAFLPSGAPWLLAGSEVHVAHLPSGRTQCLTPAAAMDWAPRWSPDGRQLAFYSDRSGRAQVWLWDRDTDRLRVVSERTIRSHQGFETPQWTPGGAGLLVKLWPEDAPMPARDPTDAPTANGGERDVHGAAAPVVWEFDPAAPPEHEAVETSARPSDWPAFTDNLRGSMALIDADTGDVRLTTPVLRTYSATVSPDGSAAALLDFVGFPSLTEFMPLWDAVSFRLGPGAADDAAPSADAGATPDDPVSPQPGEMRRLVERISQVSGVSISWSPDGAHLAYTDSESRDLFIVSAGGGEPRNLTAGHPERIVARYAESRPVWSADGRALFCTLGGPLWQVPIDGHPIRRLSAGPNHGITGVVTDGNSIAWSPPKGDSVDDEAVLAVTIDGLTKRQGIYRIGATDKPVRVYEAPVCLGSVTAFRTGDGGDHLLYTEEDAGRPPDLWISDPALTNRQRVTRLNPAVEECLFGEAQVVEWTAGDGRRLRGALLLPAAYRPGRRFPVVLEIYAGGCLSDSLHHFGLMGSSRANYQLLASRGYAVMAVDAPLQTREPRAELPDLVLPALDRLEEVGIADPGRFGVMGASFGGYSVNLLITQTNRFRAAVSDAGISDLVSAYLTVDEEGKRSDAMDWAERGQGHMGGTLWEQRDRFIENSPVFHLEAVGTPLLLLYGEEDAAVPLGQQTELFAGLRRLGKTVTLVRYPGEDHHAAETWRLSSTKDRLQRILDWFDRYL